MRYLVTGAAGFLGTNLCLRLLQSGHEVLGIDNMSSAYEPNLQMLRQNPLFSFEKHDIVNKLPHLGKFDFIYNLACPASPARYQRDPVQTFRTSVWGVWNVLQYALPCKTPVFHSSTSEIYGDPLEHPQKESYWGHVNPVGMRACYDEGKRAAETLLFDFSRKHSHPIKVVRIFNTYGPHMDPKDGRVVSNFIMQALEGKPISVYGDGTQTRSFCFVDDLMDAFLLVEKSASDPASPINLGNPDEYTLLQLIETIEQILKKKIKRKFLPLPADDPKQRRPDISIAQKIGWNPKVRLQEGLKKTIEHFKGLNAYSKR